MAGDWIKMRGNLWDDPRVAKLCDITDQPEAMVVGALYWLWATADQHTENGVMPGLTLRQIDRKTSIQGFGQALCDIGWMADHSEGVRIVNFEEHNGASAKKRCATAKRVANHRGGNDEVTQPALHKDNETVTDALAREEKRREEKKDKEPSGSLLSASRKTKLPSGFYPNENGIKTAEDSGVNVAIELRKFTDYHTAKGSLMADWQAAWRTWVGNAATFSRAGPKSSQASIEARNKAAGEEWLRQEGVT